MFFGFFLNDQLLKPNPNRLKAAPELCEADLSSDLADEKRLSQGSTLVPGFILSVYGLELYIVGNEYF